MHGSPAPVWRAPLLLAGLALLALAGFGVLRRFDPSAAGSFFPPCMFHAITGWYCPGCGLTRMLHALAHFDVPRAFSMNPLAMLAMPALAAMAAHGYGWRPRALAPLMRVLLAPYFWLVLLPTYWIARNLPWFPFTLLAPG